MLSKFLIVYVSIYRWAVSTVMTRQNQIPTEDGSKMTFALIPLWDMCNHCNGLVSLVLFFCEFGKIISISNAV